MTGGHRAAGLALATLALASALALGACRRPAPTPHLLSVRLAEESLRELAVAGVAAPDASGAAAKALEAAGFVIGPGAPAWRARVEVLDVHAVPRTDGPGLEVELLAELELTPTGEGGVARREQGSARLRGEPAGPALTAALGSAVGEAARAIRLGLASDAKPTEALLTDLDASDARLRDHAVQALGERRERRAVPGLLRRLHDGDERLVGRAVGALVQIGDPRAVPALIDLSRGDPDVVRRLVPAVAELGGPDARGWLQTLAQAHPDGAVRRQAEQALEELEARPASRARK